jgi:hypothetical protein
MSNLATTYCELGQHGLALELREKALELRQRVLPENHHQIGIK